MVCELCTHGVHIIYGRRGSARKGGREGGHDFGQPPGEAEENLEAWRGRGWPTPCLVVASVCCTLGPLAAFQLPPLPCPALPICISVAWPHRAAAAETPQLQTLASHPISYSNSLHSILIPIPIPNPHFHSTQLTHTSLFINLLLLLLLRRLHLHCLCVCVCLWNHHLLACFALLAYLLSFHCSLEVRVKEQASSQVGGWVGG